MRVHQPGGHLMAERGAQVEDWSWQKTRRRLGLLWALTQPYRRRTAAAAGVPLTTSAVNLLAEAEEVYAAEWQRRTGQTATFIIFQTPEEGIGFPMSLKGFGEGFDKLP